MTRIREHDGEGWRDDRPTWVFAPVVACAAGFLYPSPLIGRAEFPFYV